MTFFVIDDLPRRDLGRILAGVPENIRPGIRHR